jgi:hypothetical protein
MGGLLLIGMIAIAWVLAWACWTAGSALSSPIRDVKHHRARARLRLIVGSGGGAVPPRRTRPTDGAGRPQHAASPASRDEVPLPHHRSNH